MSCRETAGNSAITSYARLAASGEVTDTEVQQCFHELKRRAAMFEGEAHPHEAEVIGFLDHQAFLVRNDAKLSEARKSSLLDRLSRARAEVGGGGGLPDMPTFRAWQNLSAEVEMRAQYRHIDLSAHEPDPAAKDRLRDRLG